MRTLRILLVEDNVLIGRLLAEMLLELGHEVCAIEGTEVGAVAAAARFSPDLMIVDSHLGEGSGMGAVTAISRTGPIPHLFISGDGVRILALPPGTVSIQKPFYEADLVRAIQTVVAQTAVAKRAIGQPAPRDSGRTGDK